MKKVTLEERLLIVQGELEVSY